ncbi:hypothetical protein BFJ72_g4761 [Fusarium proliferatum]|uniref:Uncharacterized protein n=1 Tax=Gibberella intermedia TaxID=948311 RepID=A0A420TLL7_GIBIN|nr:hypothetical protein BFJ72_g4761 [Fusarium proliferatum]
MVVVLHLVQAVARYQPAAKSRSMSCIAQREWHEIPRISS